MRLFAYITFAACVALCSGCSTVGMHIFPQSTNPVYGGIRNDCHCIAHPEGSVVLPVVCTVDLPFSLVADTLWLPADMHEWSELSVPDPLTDWTYKPFPTDRTGNITTNTLDKAIVDDYEDFIKKNGLDLIGGGVDGFFEDGKGNRGVKFEGYFGNESWQYALIYDSKNKRIKTVRFDRHRYMC
jgi:uncharacterized protein YceK